MPRRIPAAYAVAIGACAACCAAPLLAGATALLGGGALFALTGTLGAAAIALTGALFLIFRRGRFMRSKTACAAPCAPTAVKPTRTTDRTTGASPPSVRFGTDGGVDSRECRSETHALVSYARARMRASCAIALGLIGEAG